jgi:hypothetical protein
MISQEMNTPKEDSRESALYNSAPANENPIFYWLRQVTSTNTPDYPQT